MPRPRLTRRSLLLSAMASAFSTRLVPAMIPGLGWAAQMQAGPAVAARPSQVIQGGNPPEYPSQGQLHAKLHINQLKGAWGWSRVGEANKDANGYPLRLVDGKASASRILRVSPKLAGIAPYAGRFRLFGQGTGRFKIAINGRGQSYRSFVLPRVTVQGEDFWFVDFTYVPKDGQRNLVSLSIEDLPQPGDHLRAMALVHETHLGAFAAGQVIMPEVIEDLSLFGHEQMAVSGRRGALRYMQFLGTNSVYMPGRENTPLTQTEPERERRFVSPAYYSFAKNQNNGGPVKADKLIPTALPVEDIVALANATGTDLWYNLAPDILDTRARDIGEYIRDHLNPELKVYWEYGNELWNGASGFVGYRYAKAKGQAAFPDLGPNDAVYEWDVYRGMQLFAQMRDIFSRTPQRSRYMAAFWAFAGSNKLNGQPLRKSYAGKYFAAEHARKKPDIGALPEDIVTDMSVGGYFGNPSQEVSNWLEQRLPGDLPAQAAAFTAMVEMGMDGDMVGIGPKRVGDPLTGVAPDTPLAVYALLRGDEKKQGRALLGDLDRMLRVKDRELQYRGIHSEKWTPIALYTSAPKTDAAGLVMTGRLTPLGRKFYGRIFNGFNSQLINAVSYRVARHAAFARDRGLQFHFYEGGPGTDGAPGSDPQSHAALMYEYHMKGWVAQVMVAFLARIGGDVAQMCWYKTHNRQYGGTDNFWGLKEYYGQPATQTPKWQVVRDTIYAGRPEKN